MTAPVRVLGGGLSGCEAALQLADAGHDVELFEMRPSGSTPAHKTGDLAELVCSNSFKGLALTSAHGLLKEELARMGSKLLPLAFEARVPAGESLAIDREAFSAAVQRAVAARPRIRLVREEVRELDPEAWTILATGPLTSEALAKDLFARIGAMGGGERLYFYDSIAPVVFADSLENEHVFAKNRWDKGMKPEADVRTAANAAGGSSADEENLGEEATAEKTPDFLNVPLDKEQYDAFVAALVEADTVEAKPFEKGQLFEGCLPIEEMARRGPETLRFGPMRPIGLHDPRTGKRPHAVIQLRAENAQKTLYNLVGFQTRLKWGTQKEILTKIPGLRTAEFARLGAMHRNTFLDSPKVLEPSLRLRGTRIFCAGQITGAEGYTEALATGLYAASRLHGTLRGRGDFPWPESSCVESLVRHLTSPNPDFQPMNFNFGLLPVDPAWSKKERKERQIEAAQGAWERFRPMDG